MHKLTTENVSGAMYNEDNWPWTNKPDGGVWCKKQIQFDSLLFRNCYNTAKICN